MNQLPVYKGFTVDYRLKEFRCIEPDYVGKGGMGLFEILPFDSDRGDHLLAEMIRKNLVPQEILSTLF